MLLQFSPLKKRAVACLFAAILFCSSCYSYKVGTRAQAGTEDSKLITANAFFWGLIQKPKRISTPICDTLGVNMSEVTVKTNFGYALITVVTLGIWCPVQLQWKCSKPCKKSGTL